MSRTNDITESSKPQGAPNLSSETPIDVNDFSKAQAGKQRRLRKKDKQSKSLIKPIWLAGHSVTIVAGLIYAFYYVQRRSHLSWIPAICYKLSLMGVWASYSISISTQFNLKSLAGYSRLIGTESVQFLILSVVWFFNRSSLFKILPFLIVALLQLSNDRKLNVILKHEATLCSIVLFNDLFLVGLLIFDTLLMRGTSGWGLVLYCLFYWLRILQFEHARYFLYCQLIKFDGIMAKVKNERVQEFWLKSKKFLTTRQARFENQYL